MKIKIWEKFTKIAEDNNSPFFRNWVFCLGTSQYKKILGIEGPTMAIFSREDRIDYLTQMDTWIKAHKDFVKKSEKNHKYVEKLIDLANDHGMKMNRWTEKQIFRAHLQRYSSGKLLRLYQEYLQLDALEYTYGVSLPILDFQGFSLVENTITNFLKGTVPARKFQHYFSTFTEPIKNSFSQDQEEALLKIVAKYYRDPVWRKSIVSLQADDVKNIFPGFYKDLEKHTQRFAWIYYVYMGPAFEEKDFLEFVKDSVRKREEPLRKLSEFYKKRQLNKKLKALYLKQLRPDHYNESMLKLAGKMVWAKPRRKDYQSRSYYHVERLQKEIAKRLFVTLQQVRNTPFQVLKSAFRQRKSSVEIANQIFSSHICVRTGNGKVGVLTGQKAENFAKKYFTKAPINKTDLSMRFKSLEGQVAFAGSARGEVKIINKPDEIWKMKTGNILVSVATTPSIIPAMKKAAAIVTDEGGLTCHAAIVSREFQIPCITGTKYATQFFRDGDIVEVDANKGIVKRIEK